VHIASGEARGLQSLNEQRASDSWRSCEFRLCYCGRAIIESIAEGNAFSFAETTSERSERGVKGKTPLFNFINDVI